MILKAVRQIAYRHRGVREEDARRDDLLGPVYRIILQDDSGASGGLEVFEFDVMKALGEVERPRHLRHRMNAVIDQHLGPVDEQPAALVGLHVERDVPFILNKYLAGPSNQEVVCEQFMAVKGFCRCREVHIRIRSRVGGPDERSIDLVL